MNDTLTPRTAMLSALYIVLLIPLTFLLNIGIAWLLDNVVLSLINWFNSLWIGWKIGLLIIGGSVVLYSILNIVRIIGGVIIFYIFKKLPDNTVTVWVSFILYLANTGWCIYALWQIVPEFTFWVFLEFIFLVMFIFSVNSLLLPWKIKQTVVKNSHDKYYVEGIVS